MNQKSPPLRVVFLLRTSYATKTGEHPIDIRVYLNNERERLGSTGVFVYENLWDSKAQKIIGSNRGKVKKNKTLETIKKKIHDLFDKLSSAGNASLNALKTEYQTAFPLPQSNMRVDEEPAFLAMFDQVAKLIEKNPSGEPFNYSFTLKINF